MKKPDILKIQEFMNSNTTIKFIILSIAGKSSKYKHNSFLVKLSCLIMLFTPLYLFYNKKAYFVGILGFFMVFFSYISDTYFCLFKKNIRKLFVFLDMFFTFIYIISFTIFILINYKNINLDVRILYCILGFSYFILCSKNMLELSYKSKNKKEWAIRHSLWHLYLTTINFIFIYLFEFSKFKKNILLDFIFIIFIILQFYLIIFTI